MKLIRITTSSLSLNTLLNGQMKYMSENGFETIMISNNDSNIQKLKTIEKSRHIIVPMKRKISLISDFFCLIKLVVIFIKENYTRAKNYLDENFKESCALVMGSEESGIRTKTSENCNSLISLSGNKNFKSFNVSVATGIILSEVLRQRRY